MKKDTSMPPPARPLDKEQITAKVKEFPVNYGASIVGITTVETLAGGPPSTDLTYVLEGARSAVTFYPSDLSAEESALLTMFGRYLMILHRNDSAAVAATTASVAAS